MVFFDTPFTGVPGRAPGVCVYRWHDGAFTLTAALDHFGDAGGTAVALNCNNQVAN